MNKEARIRQLQDEIDGIRATQKIYVVERRDENDKLDLKGPQPPWIEASEERICDYYFRHNPELAGHVAMDTIFAWYKERGWYFRLKTWR